MFFPRKKIISIISKKKKPYIRRNNTTNILLIGCTNKLDLKRNNKQIKTKKNI